MAIQAHIENRARTQPQAQTAATMSSPAAQPVLSGSIMLLLDDMANAELLSENLQAIGYRNMVLATEPATARQLLLNERPDLLLLDADLPGEGGFALLSWMRSDKSLKDTPVIMLADANAPNAVDLKLRALELEASDCLSKPVDARELALRMRNSLALARAARRSRADEQDGLTGLTNRQRFNTVLEWALTYAKRMSIVGAVLQIGVDRLGQVNEALGPSVGDRLLQAVAQRLMECVRETDMISGADGPLNDDAGASLSRIGGDEFSVLLPVIQRADQAAMVAIRIRNAMATPFQVAGNTLIVTCCIGISVFPADGTSRDLVLGNAGVAMAHAKQLGRDRHEFYSKEMNDRSRARLSLERDLRLALDQNEFSLVYQAKVGVKAGHMAGAEALLRWRHPERGMIGPVEFIPIAEEIDLITPLGEWVLRSACQQIHTWQTAGIPVPRISVNVSAQQMHQPGFEKSIRRILDEWHIAGSSITLELTESALMRDPDRTVKILNVLRESGVGISIDDFGTGYSSLAYLRRFPLDELKIDRSFLMESSEESAAIASAIIALGHSLRLKVVAEGVEHEHQLDFLRAKNCDEYQGYLFSKPIPAHAFEVLMRTRSKF